MLCSCAKKKAFKNEDGQAAIEARNAQAEQDIALVDINRAMSGQWLLRGRATASTTGVFGAFCGLSVDTSSVAQGIIRLNYDGSGCSGRQREGSITLTVQNYPSTRLSTAGCVVKVDFNAYKITKTAHGSSLQFNGTASLTNQSGGTWFDLVFLNQASLVQAITATNLSVTLNNDATVLYTISRSATYTCASGVVSCTEKGIGSHSGKTNVENWGYTREKNEFTSQITTPFVWTSVCGPVFPVSGEVTVKETAKDFELSCLYGVDASGHAVPLPATACPFGLKTSWSYKSDTRSLVFGYDN
jgi:hypothetical protein